MKTNRRSFIKHSSAALMGSLLLQNEEASAVTLDSLKNNAAADDEAFWKNVRKHFPLANDFAYLNNGTMGPSPYYVIEAVKKGMMDGDQFGNYGGWENLHAKLAAFVGADEKEIALTHNVTDGINIACWGLPLKKGDEVILTTHEHVGNAFPWLNRQHLHGIVIRTFTPAPTASETLERIASLINKKTRVLAIPHIPCTQGQILPAKEICKLGRDKGLFIFIDGAHGPGMLPLNLKEMDCDMYASCCHKWMMGPKGTGFLYVKKDFQQTLQTYFVGGGSDNAKWNMAKIPVEMGDYADSAHRYYGGTQSSGLYKGVEASIEFIESIGMTRIHERIKYLGKYTQDQLLALGDRIELLTPTEEQSRCSVNGFRIKGVDYAAFYKKAAEAKVRIRMVPENGLNSLRVSTHIYNRKEEIDLLIDEIKKAIG
ncbi:MAG: aminotransferase class V-fold PLP-dependent enzyme [Bacteroidota bacterium]|jgi:selenocysteine lyase/cysteine desulfurase|nr:aminotransferase class V-fold PLP-dependent enzyme [Sphingobacteriales bacterium]